MIRRADSLVAVSETLQTMIASEGRSATLLTTVWMLSSGVRAEMQVATR